MSLKIASETGDGSEHVGVFAPLPPELASQFPELDGDSSRPHVTLLYVGPVRKKKDQRFLVEAVREFYSQELGPIEARLSGVDYFRTQTGCVAYVKVVFSKDMGSMKDRLKSYLEDRGIEVEDNHPLAFTPHVTLKYADDPHYVWKGVTPKGSWSFQNVEVWGLDKIYRASISFGRDLENLWGPTLVKTAKMYEKSKQDTKPNLLWASDLYYAEAGANAALSEFREILASPEFPKRYRGAGERIERNLSRFYREVSQYSDEVRRATLEEEAPKEFRWVLMGLESAERNLRNAAETPGVHPSDKKRYLESAKKAEELRGQVLNFEEEVEDYLRNPLWGRVKDVWEQAFRKKPSFSGIPSPVRVAALHRQGGVYRTLSEADGRTRELLTLPTPEAFDRDLPYVAPPDEACTLSELSYLRSLEPLRVEWGAFIKAADEDIVRLFLVLCSELGVPCGREPLDKLTSEAAALITKLKWLYNRPRPYQVADREKISFSQMPSVSAGSPAYPSGHTIQANLIASRLSEAAPQHRAAFMNLAEKISFSRMVGGYHWPSDIIFGKDIFRHLVNPGMPATVRVARSRKEARTYNRIVMYDFDGTLFRSWERVPDWWKGTPLDTGPWSFFLRSESLGEPCVPDRPGGDYWISEALSAAKADARDRNTLTVLVTGRDKVHSDRVQELLSQKGLSFDRMFFNPGMPAAVFKTRVLGALLAGHPGVDEIGIWENENQDHYAKYLEAASRALGHEVEIHVHNVHEKPVPLQCGPEDF